MDVRSAPRDWASAKAATIGALETALVRGSPMCSAGAPRTSVQAAGASLPGAETVTTGVDATELLIRRISCPLAETLSNHSLESGIHSAGAEPSAIAATVSTGSCGVTLSELHPSSVAGMAAATASSPEAIDGSAATVTVSGFSQLVAVAAVTALAPSSPLSLTLLNVTANAAVPPTATTAKSPIRTCTDRGMDAGGAPYP